MDRGFIVMAGSALSLDEPCTNTHIRLHIYYVHIFMKIIELVKLVVIAGFVGAGRGDSITELAALVAISAILVVVMRLSKPFLNRWDMAVGLIAEIADLLVFTSLLIIVANGGGSNQVSPRPSSGKE